MVKTSPLAGIHPSAVVCKADAQSRKRNGGSWRNQTFNPAAGSDRFWVELTQTAELSHWSGDVADKAWLVFLGDVRRLEADLTAVNALAAVNAMFSASRTKRQGGAHAGTRMR
jgi:hypothetical protein